MTTTYAIAHITPDPNDQRELSDAVLVNNLGVQYTTEAGTPATHGTPRSSGAP